MIMPTLDIQLEVVAEETSGEKCFQCGTEMKQGKHIYMTVNGHRDPIPAIVLCLKCGKEE